MATDVADASRIRALRMPAPAPVAIGLITLVAAILRLTALGRVAHNPFYDAAVRSMGTSVHAFLLGAFEPSGSLSIDKPPVDLWLQVASTKLLGFNQTTLRLPEALAGTLSVPLLYDAVRRVFGAIAGFVAAVVLAVLPVEVLTARSDTMDAVMAFVLVCALWCLIRAATTCSSRWIYAMAACLGVAFNIKLFEALVPLPALAVGAWLVLRSTRLTTRRQIIHVVSATAVLIAVSLSWLTATLFVSHPPYAIGSTNGSAWNAAFVYNGYDRIASPPRDAVKLRPRRPVDSTRRTTAVARKVPNRPKHIHITAPGLARLLPRRGPLPAARFGLAVLAAICLGFPALWFSRRRGPPTRPIAVTLALWTLTGTALFSAMSRLHPRYVESVTPAVAACAGIGVAWLSDHARTPRHGIPAALLVGVTTFAVWGTGGSASAWLGLLVAIIVAAVVVRPSAFPLRGAWRVGGIAVLATVALSTASAAEDVHIVKRHLSDSGNPGAMPGTRVRRLSAFLRSHRAGARWEFGVAAATQAGELVARDGQPALALTSFNGRPLISVTRLRRLVAAGDVRYFLLGGGSCTAAPRTIAACAQGAAWVRRNGIDVSRSAGVYRGLLWEVGPGARAHQSRRGGAAAAWPSRPVR